MTKDEWIAIKERLKLDDDYIDIRHNKEELKEFIEDLNFRIQVLGLNKEETIAVVNSLYREDTCENKEA